MYFACIASSFLKYEDRHIIKILVFIHNPNSIAVVHLNPKHVQTINSSLLLRNEHMVYDRTEHTVGEEDFDPWKEAFKKIAGKSW